MTTTVETGTLHNWPLFTELNALLPYSIYFKQFAFCLPATGLLLNNPSNGLNKTWGTRMTKKILTVKSVDVGFSFSNGETPALLVVVAKGLVNTSGWTGGELAAWLYIEEPADGILDMDFIAKEPAAGSIVVQRLTELESEALLISLPAWVKGVRVHASSNHIVRVFEEVKDISAEQHVFYNVASDGGGNLFPWAASK